MRHEVAVWPDKFKSIKDGSKTFIIRVNDKDYSVGDVLHFRELNPETKFYSRQEALYEVIYIEGYKDSQNNVVKRGHVAMAIKPHSPFAWRVRSLSSFHILDQSDRKAGKVFRVSEKPEKWKAELWGDHFASFDNPNDAKRAVEIELLVWYEEHEQDPKRV